MNNSSNMSTADLQNHNNLYGHNNMHPYMAQQQQQQQHPHHHHQPQYLPQRQQHPMMVMSNMKHDEDDMDFHDNKSETSSRSGGCNSKSKVFQCTGYGECSMVFTRSEHLARHMRKHTGEKPFKCVVPGCERMFSRFDNMMQHTQTHNKTRSGPRRNSNKPVKTKRGGGKKCSGTIRRANSSDDYDEYGPLPSPPPSRRGSSNVITKEHQIILPNPKYLEVDEEEDDDISDDDQQGGPSEPRQQQHRSHHQQASYKNSNRKGGSRYPDSPASSDSSNHDYFAPIKPIHRRRSAPRIHYQPYPYQYSEQPEVIPVLPRRNSALSQLATYLCNNPDQSPESYLSQQSQQQQQSSTTQHQDDKDEEPPKELSMTRRLSIQDLSNPLNEVSSGSSSMEDDEEEEGVSLTEDEYQAIQGFGQFYRPTASVTSCNK